MIECSSFSSCPHGFFEPLGFTCNSLLLKLLFVNVITTSVPCITMLYVCLFLIMLSIANASPTCDRDKDDSCRIKPPPGATQQKNPQPNLDRLFAPITPPNGQETFPEPYTCPADRPAEVCCTGAKIVVPGTSGRLNWRDCYRCM